MAKRSAYPKITFPQLVETVADATETTSRVSELFLKELFATIKQSLVDGRQVTIDGLGTFTLETVRGTEARASYNKVAFVISPELATKINAPFANFKPVELDVSLDDVQLEAVADADDGPDDGPVVITPPPFTPPTSKSDVIVAGNLEEEPPVAPEPEPAPQPEPEPEPKHEPEPEPEPEPKHEPEPEPEPEQAVTEPFQATEVIDRAVDGDTVALSGARDGFWKGFAAGAVAASLLLMAAWLAWWYVYKPINYYASNAGVTPSTDIRPAGNVVDDSIIADTISSQPVITASQSIPPQVITDTITGTLYLTKMSRKHYVKPEFWVYIYEENRDKIDNPNTVPPGTVLIIPPREKYGIDPNDRASVEKARRLQYEIYTKNGF